jgi:hypothetical protein
MAETALDRPRQVQLQRVLAEAELGWRSRWRLQRIVRKARSEHLQYTFEHLLAKAGTIPPEVLSVILAGLVELGLARRVIRIESPSTRGGLQDCDSLEEIPLSIPDVNGQEIPVTPEMLKVVYKF